MLHWIHAIGLAAALLQGSSAPAPVRYDVSPDVKSVKWKVSMALDVPAPGPFELWIPRWTPGGYHLVDFGQFVEEVKAKGADGLEVKVDELDEPVHWKIDPGKSPRVRIDYTARVASTGPFDATALDVEANRITDTHAFLNSTSLFAFVPGTLDRPVEVKLELPEGWKAASALVKNEKGLYTAPSYYRLEDSPFLMAADLQVVPFTVAKIPHEVATTGKSASDAKALAEVCEKVVDAGRRVMGGLPYDRYVFLLGFLPEGGMGGLEHSYSTLILLPNGIPTSMTHHVIAHEFFHLWCAERIQVQELRKPDYTKPFVTGTIWHNEGITEYMAHVLLFHGGLLDETQFLAEMASKNAGNHARSKAATRKSQIDFSKGWVNATLPDFIEINTGIYDRGCVNGFALDLLIRARTEGKKGIVDVLRHLMAEYHDKGKGFGEDELPEIYAKVTGLDLTEFFDRYVAGRELPDLDPFLAPYGWKLRRTSKGAPGRGAFQDLEEVTDAQRALREAFFRLPPLPADR